VKVVKMEHGRLSWILGFLTIVWSVKFCNLGVSAAAVDGVVDSGSFEAAFQGKELEEILVPIPLG